eukprot:EG_transcript_3780
MMNPFLQSGNAVTRRLGSLNEFLLGNPKRSSPVAFKRPLYDGFGIEGNDALDDLDNTINYELDQFRSGKVWLYGVVDTQTKVLRRGLVIEDHLLSCAHPAPSPAFTHTSPRKTHRLQALCTALDTDALPRKLFINNVWAESKTGLKYATINPATEEVICEVSEAGEADVAAAVAAAKAALEGSWRAAGPYARSKLLWKLADLIERDVELLAALESLDNGKPFLESSTVDLPLVIQCFRYYAGAADKLHGNTVTLGGPLVDETFTAYTLHEPVGVVGQIIPWNFPLLMAAWKLGPALAVGCTVVLKLAEQTPLTGLYLGKLIKEAGFPPGVVNILSGFGDKATDGSIGAGLALLRHPDVNKVAFTGSSSVGRIVMRECAKDFKRVTLELGGKSPNIIFPDADLDGAVAGALISQFFNQGQVCCAGSRTFVHEDIYEEFIDRLQKATKARQKLGDPLHPETTQGPQVSLEQFNQVMNYIEVGKKEGAKCLFGGERQQGSKGYFIQPTAFVDVQDGMRIWTEEIFGPVMAIAKFRTMDEAISRANYTVYGLAAAVWTKDLGTAQYMQRRLRAGTVWINCYNVFDANMAFGGYKSSGIGRELAQYALENYTEVKQVCVKSAPRFK